MNALSSQVQFYGWYFIGIVKFFYHKNPDKIYKRIPFRNFYKTESTHQFVFVLIKEEK